MFITTTLSAFRTAHKPNPSLQLLQGATYKSFGALLENTSLGPNPMVLPKILAPPKGKQKLPLDRH